MEITYRILPKQNVYKPIKKQTNSNQKTRIKINRQAKTLHLTNYCDCKDTIIIYIY